MFMQKAVNLFDFNDFLCSVTSLLVFLFLDIGYIRLFESAFKLIIVICKLKLQ
ncbi:hypothetical protein Hanom_Chr04g00286141 [Helianthus anomalus]